MIPKPLDNIQEADLQTLIDNQIAEGKTIEYKRELPGMADGEKIKLLRSVSSFANAEGGDLLYGVEAVDGIPQSIPGVGNINEDDLKLRLENICRDGIEPRLPKIEFRYIPNAQGRVLLIRVSKSWVFPHRVKLGGHAHFYGRNSAGAFPLDVGELRTAFTLSESIAEKIRNFRLDRLSKLHAHDTPIPILIGCKLALHLIPLSAFSSSDKIDVSQYHERLREFYPYAANGAQLWKINLDGVLNYTNPGDGRSRAYTQVFRDGSVEAVAVFSPGEDGVKRILSKNTESYLIQCLRRYLGQLQGLDISPPFFLFLSFLGTTGYHFIVPVGPGNAYGHETSQTDRDVLAFPEIAITDYGLAADQLLRPLFDMMWNAFGYPGSRNFNAAGNWVV